jgi:proton-translocating NADH-quinone oxidoreductase chain L
MLLIFIIIIPLMSSILCGFCGKFIGYRGATLLSTCSLGITFMLSVYSLYVVGFLKHPFYITYGYWIRSDTLHVDWSFLFDSLSVTMLFVVTLISTLVHLYSSSYMSGDPHITRFMSYLSLFTFFMIILVTADNFLQLFLGWEGVGICSYLLINFWFTRVQANKAALKALILNRVGDFSLMLAIIIIFIYFRTLDYSVVFVLAPFFINKTICLFSINFLLLDVICFFLFIAAVGKSAQLGLHTWLPDAMEGPTPVSALIHAATMVTAGIFLIIRCSPLFEYSKTVLSLIVIVGVITSFFAATVGLVQNDIKKIIAYSTCSQLGYMFFACGFSQYSLSLFHLSNHAFFKALLFLGAGAVIHSMNNEQDIRYMGNLDKFMPITYITMLIGSLSLAGFPFFSGFYSKDVILEVALVCYGTNATFTYWLATTAALFTSIYSFRLIILVFIVRTNSFKHVFSNVHEASKPILFSLILLSFFSIFSGYLTKEIFIGLGSDFFWDSILILPKHTYLIDIEFLPYTYKNIPTLFSLFGIGITFVSYSFISFELKKFILDSLGFKSKHIDIDFTLRFKKINLIYKFLSNKWYFDFIYNKYIGENFLLFSYNICFKLIDKGIIEILGPTGITSIIYKLSINLGKEQSGYIYQYLCLSLIFVLLVSNYMNLIFYT